MTQLWRMQWSNRALDDLARLRNFLVASNPVAAARTFKILGAAPQKLRTTPRLGSRIKAETMREIRKIILGDYEMRYELADSTITILRIWHTREDR